MSIKKSICPSCGKKSLVKNLINKNLECLNCPYIHKNTNQIKINQPFYEAYESTEENVKKKKTDKRKNGKIHPKDIKILNLLQDNPEGLRAINISKALNMKERTLYNHLYKLVDLDLLIDLNPIWKIANFQALSLNMAKYHEKSNLQSHKFSFVLKLINKPSWWENRENHLMRLKEFNFKPVVWGNNPYEQMHKDQFLIQTFSTAIVFINQKKYWATNPYDAFIEALLDTLQMLSFIEERFKFTFFPNAIPNFSVRSQHYVNLRDALAEKCKKEGKGFNIEVNGKLRGWIDFSDPFGTEFGHKDYAPEDASRYRKQIADFIENDPPTNSELSKFQAETSSQIRDIVFAVKSQNTLVSGLPPVLADLKQQIASHLALIQDYRKESIARREAYQSEAKRSEKKSLNNFQSKLGDFL